MDLHLTLTEALDHRAKEAALYQHNVERTGVAGRPPIGAVATDRNTGEVVGGLRGRTELGLLLLDMFHLPATLRGQSAGSGLLALVDDEAKTRGCRHAVVETSTFQAPAFYEPHGYAEFGRVPFSVEGHARMFLSKALA